MEYGVFCGDRIARHENCLDERSGASRPPPPVFLGDGLTNILRHLMLAKRH